MYEFLTKYQKIEEGSLKIYLDHAVNPALESEIFVDINLTHYPLRDHKNGQK